MPELPPQQSPKPESESKKHFDLATLLIYENPDAKKIADLVEQEERQRFATPSTSFSHFWKEGIRLEGGGFRPSRLVAENLKAGVLVNLGGTDSPFPEILDHGPDVVIDVDRYWDSLSHFQITGGEVFEKNPVRAIGYDTTKKGKDILKVKSDMLDFISRVASNSVNVEIDGIDHNIITPVYREALVGEILRVTKQGGLILSCGSDDIVRELLRNENIEDLFPEASPSYGILRKKL